MKKFWKVVLASFVGCILALGILFLISFGMIGSLASFASKPAASVPSNAILHISFDTPVSAQGGEKMDMNLLSLNASFGNSMSLYSLVKAIDVAATDPQVRFIYMTPETPALSVAQAEEVRAALARFRASGKAVVSYSTQLNNLNYYLASVADKVMLNTYGDVMLTGLSSNVVFFKDLADKLGVEMQLIRHGKYKAAGEQFTKNDLTPENREQMMAMLNALWGSMVKEIADSRDFTGEQFNEMIDKLVLTGPAEALQNGVVDQLCYRDELETYLCSLAGVSDAKNLKFVTVEDYASVKVKADTRAKSKVAVVYASGEIVVDSDKDGDISGMAMAQMLSEIRKDSTIKAVVFRVDSPGGSAQGAEMINRELGMLKEVKPVVASYGDYAASGGYWISARADRIFTDNTTLTGSIGVFSLVPAFGKAIRQTLKVNPVVIGTNEHSGMLSGMNKFDDAETKYMEANVEKVYTDFTALVAEGRNMTVEAVDEIGQGRVWAGADALNIGLADQKGGLMDAIEYAAGLAGLDSYHMVTYPAVKTMMEKILETFSSAKSTVRAISDPVSCFEEACSTVSTEMKPRTYARMPYVFGEIR